MFGKPGRTTLSFEQSAMKQEETGMMSGILRTSVLIDDCQGVPTMGTARGDSGEEVAMIYILAFFNGFS
jgi:hypothetical protein